MKNPNGYGGIFKLQGKRRKPWAVRVSTGLNENGNQNFKYLGYFATNKEAKMFLANFNADPSIINEIPTIEQIYDKFLKSLEIKNKSLKTIDMYKTTWNYFDAIKDESITELKTSVIQDIIDDLVFEEYSYSTVNKVKILASQLLKSAMADDLVNKNYASLVTLPKNSKKEIIRFSDKELIKIKELAKTDDWAKTVLIMIYGLMRVGTLLNLKKFDIDLEQGLIRGGNKTDADRDKVVPIHPQIFPYLQYFYSKSKSEFLITHKNKKVNYRYYLDIFYAPVLEKCGIDYKSTHACKRTGVSLLRNANADPLLITKMAGHTKESTTERYYTDIEIETLRNAILSIS